MCTVIFRINNKRMEIDCITYELIRGKMKS